MDSYLKQINNNLTNNILLAIIFLLMCFSIYFKILNIYFSLLSSVSVIIIFSIQKFEKVEIFHEKIEFCRKIFVEIYYLNKNYFIYFCIILDLLNSVFIKNEWYLTNISISFALEINESTDIFNIYIFSKCVISFFNLYYYFIPFYDILSALLSMISIYSILSKIKDNGINKNTIYELEKNNKILIEKIKTIHSSFNNFPNGIILFSKTNQLEINFMNKSAEIMLGFNLIDLNETNTLKKILSQYTAQNEISKINNTLYENLNSYTFNNIPDKYDKYTKNDSIILAKTTLYKDKEMNYILLSIENLSDEKKKFK